MEGSRNDSLIALRDRREQVIEQLSDRFATDALDVDELERRIDLAHQATSVAALDALVADLDLEVKRSVLTSGMLQEHAGRYEVVGGALSLAIPATLQDLLMARLDRLGSVRELAQRAAVVGRDFSYDLLQALVPDEVILQKGLQQLVDAELIYQRGAPPAARYSFRHALVQDAAYQSLLKNKRRHLHGQVALAIEARFPEIVEVQPELVAFHYTQAEQPRSATHY